MKKNAIIVVLIWALIVSILLPYRQSADALGDPMTLTQISGLAYALGNSWGLNFTMSGLTPSGVQSYFENSINKWMAGSTILEKFGGEAARIAAGKLIVPHLLYNGIKEFIQSFITDNNITDVNQNISVIANGSSYSFNGIKQNTAGNWAGTYLKTVISTGQETILWGGSSPGSYKQAFKGFIIENNILYGVVDVINPSTDKVIFTKKDSLGSAGTSLDSVGADMSGTIPETVLNPDEQWTGTIGGEDWPDTNIDQLIGRVYEDVADNNLDVDGEVGPIDPPPTPIPTVVPGDIDGYWNRQSEQLDGLGNDIGDISGQLDDLGQQAGNIIDALEGVNQGIQSQTGVISGALDQATQDVIDAIGEQTGVLDESLTQTAEGVQEIADTLQPGEIEPQQFDLRRLFPFCIPFDIHNFLQKFNAEPVAPHVQLPFVIQSIGFSYMFDLDFSSFDPVAAAMRTVEFIVFAIGLAWATSKVIKW